MPVTASVLILSATLATMLPASQAHLGGPTDLEQQFEHALAHYKSGQLQVAASELESLAQHSPKRFGVQELLGLVYSAEGKNAEASAHFEKAVRLKPNSAPARLNLAVSWASLGKAGLAETQFKRAAQLDPSNYEANRDLGEFYARRGKVLAAIPYLERAQRDNPLSYENGFDLALAYEKTGKLEKAQQQIQRLLKLKDTAQLHGLLGEVDEKAGNYVGAVNAYQQAVNISPSESNIFDLGRELLLHSALSRTIKVFREGVTRYPKSARLAIGLGIALYWSGKYEKAMQALLKATELAPANPLPYYFLSKAYDSVAVSQMSRQASDEVVARFRRFAAQRPQNGRAAYYYAMSLRKTKEAGGSNTYRGEVESLLKKSIRLDPSLAKAHFELGSLYSDQGKYLEAIPEYQRTLKIDPNLAEAYYRLGQAYVHTGQKKLAQKEFRLHQQVAARHVAKLAGQREQSLWFAESKQKDRSVPKH